MDDVLGGIILSCREDQKAVDLMQETCNNLNALEKIRVSQMENPDPVVTYSAGGIRIPPYIDFPED